MLILYAAGWLASLAGMAGVEGWRLMAATALPSWADRLGWLFAAWLAGPLIVVSGPWLAWRARRLGRG
jgi:hypothetical protein